jgi:hypothetical protein
MDSINRFEQLAKGNSGKHVSPPDIPMTAEKEANNVPYKGFILYRCDPTRTWFWKIKTDIQELAAGVFTKLTEAQKAIDVYRRQQKEKEIQNETREEAAQATTNEAHGNG